MWPSPYLQSDVILTLDKERVQWHRGKNHLSSHEIQVGHVVNLSGSVSFSWRAEKIKWGETVSATVFCLPLKKMFVWYMRCLLNLLQLRMMSDSVTCSICFTDGSDLWPWRRKHSTLSGRYRCKRAMLKCYYHCHLPVKTLTAHRACISTTVMIGPAAWNRPMTASVGGDRETGNNLLKWKTTQQMNTENE